MTATNARKSRRRGATGEQTRQLLNALREPGRLSDVMSELGWTEEETHALIKHAHEQRRIDRLARGVYRTNAAGLAALDKQDDPRVRYLNVTAPRPPEGKRWTPERKAWLDRAFPRLGAQRCAQLLGVSVGATRTMAAKRGLKFGDLPDYTLLADLADLTGQAYTNLYVYAERAGVLTFPGTTRDNRRRPAAMVPDAWADELVSEMQPPTPDDVALHDLRLELNLSQTQAARKASGHSYLRTPVHGGQARLHVSREFADQLRAEYRERRKQPRTREIGRQGYLAAFAAAGTNGATERELYEQLQTSRAAVRIHTRALLRDGQLERCRAGTTLDPFVYRLLIHQGQPEPTQRLVVITGRPRKTPLPQAAD